MTEAMTLHGERVLVTVDEFFDGVFDAIHAWVPELSRTLETPYATGGLTGAQLATLVEPGAQRVLDSTTLPLYGAGFCAADVLMTEGNPLAW